MYSTAFIKLDINEIIKSLAENYSIVWFFEPIP